MWLAPREYLSDQWKQRSRFCHHRRGYCLKPGTLASHVLQFLSGKNKQTKNMGLHFAHCLVYMYCSEQWEIWSPLTEGGSQTRRRWALLNPIAFHSLLSLIKLWLCPSVTVFFFLPFHLPQDHLSFCPSVYLSSSACEHGYIKEASKEITLLVKSRQWTGNCRLLDCLVNVYTQTTYFCRCPWERIELGD